MKNKKDIPEELPAESAAPEREYEESTWAGQAQCKCRLCAFDTLDKARMLKHLVDVHASMRAPEELVASEAAPTAAAIATETEEEELGND